MKKIYLIITFLIVVALTLEAGVIYLSNQRAGNSLSVSKMKDEIATLTEENRHLKKNVLKNTSLKNIASKAAELGFTSDVQTISLSRSERIASR